MLVGLTTFAALLLQLGATPPAAAGASDLESYHVTRPGEVLLARAARGAWLATLPAEQRDVLCGKVADDWRSHKANTRLKTP